MTCKEILNQWLKDNGYDGLYYPGECACMREQLITCEGYCGECEPGYLHKCEPGDEYDFRIGPEKPEGGNDADNA